MSSGGREAMAGRRAGFLLLGTRARRRSTHDDMMAAASPNVCCDVMRPDVVAAAAAHHCIVLWSLKSGNCPSGVMWLRAVLCRWCAIEFITELLPVS